MRRGYSIIVGILLASFMAVGSFVHSAEGAPANEDVDLPIGFRNRAGNEYVGEYINRAKGHIATCEGAMGSAVVQSQVVGAVTSNQLSGQQGYKESSNTGKQSMGVLGAVNSNAQNICREAAYDCYRDHHELGASIEIQDKVPSGDIINARWACLQSIAKWLEELGVAEFAGLDREANLHKIDSELHGRSNPNYGYGLSDYIGRGSRERTSVSGAGASGGGSGVGSLDSTGGGDMGAMASLLPGLAAMAGGKEESAPSNNIQAEAEQLHQSMTCDHQGDERSKLSCFNQLAAKYCPANPGSASCAFTQSDPVDCAKQDYNSGKCLSGPLASINFQSNCQRFPGDPLCHSSWARGKIGAGVLSSGEPISDDPMVAGGYNGPPRVDDVSGDYAPASASLRAPASTESGAGLTVNLFDHSRGVIRKSCANQVLIGCGE